jgi:hypothetical protein
MFFTRPTEISEDFEHPARGYKYPWGDADNNWNEEEGLTYGYQFIDETGPGFSAEDGPGAGGIG